MVECTEQIVPQVDLERREKIAHFEEALKASPNAIVGEHDGLPLEHTFADGIYCRKIIIPAGTLCTGKIHRHKHPNVLLKGHVMVYTEQNAAEELIAPQFMVNEPGTKRIVYALEDTEWMTFHRVDSLDLDEIEKEVIAPDYNSLDVSDRKELR